MNSNIKNNGIEKLHFNHAGAMQLKDGQIVNYGVIRKDNKEVVYYTGKGLREIWKPNMSEVEKKYAEKLKLAEKDYSGEQTLIDSGHIAKMPLDQIERVIF